MNIPTIHIFDGGIDRLAERIFDEINQITLPGEGITRPSYSIQETEAIYVIDRWAKEFGLVTSVDGVGNLHCTIDGTFADEGEVVTGSHLDSVPHGGRYDGTAGVVAGLLALKMLAASSRTRRKPRLIVFRGEESAWFGKCYLGSLGLFGLLTKEDLARRSALDNETLGRRIAHRGGWEEYAGQHPPIGRKILQPAGIARFIEVHIEQGPVLHDAGVHLGIVDSIRGNYRYRKAQIVGEAGHSGTTPSRLRKDAVLAFADLMQRLEQGAKVFGEDLVMTCGVAGTDPARHSATTIADVVNFDLEFRSSSETTLELFDTFYRACVAAVLEQRKLPPGLLGIHTKTASAAMDPEVRADLLRIAHLTLDTEDPMHLPSGAGHDAAVFAGMGVPTGMIFIRNEHGSHNPRESMRLGDFLLATGVLYRAMGGLVIRCPRLLALWALLLLVACGGQAPSTDAMAPPQGAAAMAQPPIVYGLISVGQSNGLGVDKTDPPAGLPDPSIPFWRNDYYANDGTHAFGPLDVAPRGRTFSHEIRMAQRFKEAGLTVAVIKLCQGATFINRWIPTAKAPGPGSKLYAEVREAALALRAAYPGAEVRFIWVWDQGEAEARYADRPTVELWPDDFFAIQAGLEEALGQTLHPFVMRTCSTITGKTFPGLLEGLQASVTTADHVIDTNDSDFMPDGVHRRGHSQNTLGDRIADVALAEVTP